MARIPQKADQNGQKGGAGKKRAGDRGAATGAGAASALVRGRPARRPPPTAAASVKKLLAAHRARFGETAAAPTQSAALARQWGEIVGPRLARLSRAERITGRGRDGVLHIAAVGPAAVLIEADSARLLERVNDFSGRVVAGRLAIRPLAAEPAGPAAPVRASLPLRAVRRLDQALEPVCNPELKSALKDLGRAALSLDPSGDAEGR